MPRIRIVQPGFTTYTGDLHTVTFTNGVSDIDISVVKAQQIAAQFLIEDYAVPNQPYGTANTILPMSRAADPAPTSVPG